MADLLENLVFREEDVIHFKNGIPGFDQFNRYVLVTLEEHRPFQWLVCVENRLLRFALINPLCFRPDYNPRVSKEQFEDLEIEDKADLSMFAIITLNTPIMESTANLMGPLFINTKKKLGKQIVLDDDFYSTREPLVQDSKTKTYPKRH